MAEIDECASDSGHSTPRSSSASVPANELPMGFVGRCLRDPSPELTSFKAREGGQTEEKEAPAHQRSLHLRGRRKS